MFNNDYVQNIYINIRYFQTSTSTISSSSSGLHTMPATPTLSNNLSHQSSLLPLLLNVCWFLLKRKNRKNYLHEFEILKLYFHLDFLFESLHLASKLDCRISISQVREQMQNFSRCRICFSFVFFSSFWLQNYSHSHRHANSPHAKW